MKAWNKPSINCNKNMDIKKKNVKLNERKMKVQNKL